MNNFIDFTQAIFLLRELDDATKYLNESELINKYQDKLKQIPHELPIRLNDSFVIYRSRLASNIGRGEDIILPTTFSYPPFTLKPNRGRMNLTGQSVFYASSSPETNYREIKKDIKAGEEVYLSQWNIAVNSGFSVYTVVTSDNISETADDYNCICIKDPKIINTPIGDYLRYLSDIILRKETNNDKEYLASSLISSIILNEIKGKIKIKGKESSFHYDAIAYPNTRIGNGKADYYNFVINPEFIDNHASLRYVIKGKLQEDLQSITCENIGFNHEGIIDWYEPYICLDDVIINPIGFIDKDFTFVDINDDIIVKDKVGKIVSKEGLFMFLNNNLLGRAYKEFIVKKNSTKDLFMKLRYGEMIDETSSVESPISAFIEINDWILEKKNKHYDITSIVVNATYKNIFRKIEDINSITETRASR